MKERLFRETWERLAAQHQCDAIDSQQFRRVHAEWMILDCPEPFEKFISWRASVNANGGHEGFDADVCDLMEANELNDMGVR